MDSIPPIDPYRQELRAANEALRRDLEAQHALTNECREELADTRGALQVETQKREPAHTTRHGSNPDAMLSSSLLFFTVCSTSW